MNHPADELYARARERWKNEDHESALRHLRDAVRMKPDHAEALNLMGLILHQSLGKPELAEKTLRLAIRANPAFAGPYIDLGNIFHQQGREQEAQEMYTTALQLDPRLADPYTNLGVLLHGRNEVDKAIQLYRMALKYEPDHVNSHWNLATALLVMGAYEEGWHEFEWRPVDKWARSRPFTRPRLASLPPPGSTIFVYDEQGFGDTIQFSRYLRQLKSLGCRVVFECQPALVSLLSRLQGVDKVIPRNGAGEPSTPYDFYLRLLSLPHFLSSVGESPEGPAPYITPDPALVDIWRQRVGEQPGFKVGLVWGGNPHHKNDKNRSVKAADLAILGKIPGVRLFSLQKGEPAEQLAVLRQTVEVVDLGSQARDFSDTAAALANLDLLLTVDTSVAHLAGAMGIPVWTLVPPVPDWRWMLEGDASAFYPSMKLWRRSMGEEWPTVLSRVAAALRETSCGVPEVDAMMARGVGLESSGNITDACALYRQVVQSYPTHAVARFNLGHALASAGNRQEALASYKEAVRLDPSFVEAWVNLGCLLAEMGDVENAIDMYKEALACNPVHSGARNNLGLAYRELGLFQEALKQFDAAIGCDAENAEAHLNRALILLQQEKFSEGWKEFRWRTKLQDSHRYFRSGIPDTFSLDAAKVAGRRIVVTAEQGAGDHIQFCRYLPMLAAAGAKVRFVCSSRLHPLLAQLPGVTLDPEEHPRIAEADEIEIPLFSLAALIGPGSGYVAPDVPYLHADSALIEHWKPFVQSASGLRVGFGWQGNKDFRGDRERSFPLAAFANVLRVSGASFFSLQKGFGAEQLAQLPPDIHVRQMEEAADTSAGAFMDTAAVIDNLDLVITSDTSIAHLAGALGKIVWLALPFVSDWRWFCDRNDSPWYPTMRLFRQPRRGDWESVFLEIRAALEATIAGESSEHKYMEQPLVPREPQDARAWLRLASALTLEERYEEAADAAREAIALDPFIPEHHAALGAIRMAQSKPEEAIPHYAAAIRLQPEAAAFHNDVGNAYRLSGDMESAICSYRRALALAPDAIPAIINLGNALSRAKNYAEACSVYEKGTLSAPGNAELWYLLGNARLALDLFVAAVDAYEQSLRLNPENPEAHFRLGTVYAKQEKHELALGEYEAALRGKPDFAEVYHALGLLALARNHPAKAQECFAMAIKFKPGFAPSYDSLGSALIMLERHADALPVLREALRLNPSSLTSRQNLGIVLGKTGAHQEAVEEFKKVLQVDSSLASGHFNLGSVLAEQHRLPEALASFDEGLRLEPENAGARLNRAILYLLMGRMSEGWKEYEWRFKIKESRTTVGGRDAGGGELGRLDLTGKRLHVYIEQGLGDTLQFARFLPLARQHCASVSFECQKELLPLLKDLPGVDVLMERTTWETPQIPFDIQLPLLSLPRVLGTTLETIPADIPYIVADRQLAAHFGPKFPKDALNIGIVWAGNPHHPNDKNRSCAFSVIAPLLKIPGTRWFSLQKGEPAQQLAQDSLSANVVDIASELATFSDTAAVIANLDLVIAVDTSVAHLAGAMGKHVWILLPYTPDWRWMLDRSDSPWYPTARLWRQDAPGTWANTIHAIAAELGRFRHVTEKRP